MKSENQFFNDIKSKVDADEAGFTWPKEEIWTAIENKQRKRRGGWIFFAAAASILLFLSVSGLWLYNDGSPKVSLVKPQLENSKKKNQPVNKNSEIILSKKQLTEKIKKGTKMAGYQRSTAILSEQDMVIETIKDENENPAKPLTFEKIELQKVASRSGVPFVEINIDKANISLINPADLVVPNQAIEQRVILIIPEIGEVKRKRLAGRLIQQVGNFNTEGKFDWEEVNVKPQKPWAYLKESVKTEPNVAKAREK